MNPNPPPNLSCRYFTHATETIIWAAKDKKSRHTFHYKLMKETNRGKQMKSVWEIRPPEPWEKRFGKHPTQKPVALLERILLASTNEGDLVLDPFAGSGTTLLTACSLRRQAVGCELSAEFLALSLRSLCSNLVQLQISVACLQFSVDPPSDPMDRSSSARFPKRAGSRNGGLQTGVPRLCSGRGPSRAAFDFFCMSPQLHLVQQERRFYFIGHTKREIDYPMKDSRPERASRAEGPLPGVLFTVAADSLDEARQKFRNAGHPDSDALFIIKTETEIYLA